MGTSDELQSLRKEMIHARDELERLSNMVDLLISVLVARGDLDAAQRKLFDKACAHVDGSRQRIHLAVAEDKRALPELGIDCPSLLHLCKARCCSFTITLSRADVEDGRLAIDVDEPFRLRRGPDGYCAHLDRASAGCTAYEHRPASCRRYDCREDQRVWLDWEQKIPAPLPDTVRTPV